MGKKGDKQTGAAAEAVADFTAQITPLGDVTSKKMFGGYGVFEGGKMFALVDSQGRVFMKVVDGNRERFAAAGAEKHGRMPYYQIPAAVLADESALLEWTAEAIKLSK